MPGCLPTQRAVAMAVLTAVSTIVLKNTERYTLSNIRRPGRRLPQDNIFPLTDSYRPGLRSDLPLARADKMQSGVAHRRPTHQHVQIHQKEELGCIATQRFASLRFESHDSYTDPVTHLQRLSMCVFAR